MNLASDGKLVISREDWLKIGQKAGWTKTAAVAMNLPAQIQVITGAIPVNTGYQFSLTLEVSGYDIALNPADPQMKELYNLVQQQMAKKTPAATPAATPPATPAAPAATPTPTAAARR